ncbi:DUF6580 family putative transport protein [Balneola sp. MJW-20]|uniref:DUF6580 family putative transport protein n=1 Tax=Gracilimonas aurantiaca TaxID=3234185 RepID=UPI003467359C
MNKKRIYLISGFILLAAISRLFPHPTNFTPIGAISIFGAAYFSDKKLAFLLPLFAMFISDLLVNNILFGSFYDGFMLFTPGFWYIYGSIALMVLVGFVFLKKVTVSRVIGGGLVSSVLFFLITNAGVWLGSPLYPQTLEGLMSSYAMGIPFFQYSVLGTLFYSAIMFGAFEYAKNRFPDLQKKEIRL